MFSSFEPGPKAMKEIIGDVLDVKQEDNKIVAQIKISKEWESKIKPIPLTSSMACAITKISRFS